MALPGFAAAAPPVFTIQTIAGGEYRDKAVLALAAQPARVERIGISSKGVMYLADTAAHRVRKITPDGLTQNGTGSAGPQARLNPPFAVETNFRATSTSTISATPVSAGCLLQASSPLSSRPSRRCKSGSVSPSDDPRDPSPLKVRDVRVEDQRRYIVCLMKIGRPGIATIGKRWSMM